eukprot:gene549-1050_t
MAVEEIKTALNNCFKTPYVQGQIISVLLAANGIFASLLSENDSNFPELMSFVFYLSLSSFFFYRLYKSTATTFTHPWYWYSIIAFFDVEGNFLMILAFNYTSITSIALLDCFAIPCVVMLSYLFLNAQYKRAHFMGASIAIVGMICTVISDLLNSSQSDSYPDALFGDILALVAASFYACSNVLQEKLVKTGDSKEFLGLLGVNGAILTLIQVQSPITLIKDPDTSITDENTITSPMQLNYDVEGNLQVQVEDDIPNDGAPVYGMNSDIFNTTAPIGELKNLIYRNYLPPQWIPPLKSFKKQLAQPKIKTPSTKFHSFTTIFSPLQPRPKTENPPIKSNPKIHQFKSSSKTIATTSQNPTRNTLHNKYLLSSIKTQNLEPHLNRQHSSTKLAVKNNKDICNFITARPRENSGFSAKAITEQAFSEIQVSYQLFHTDYTHSRNPSIPGPKHPPLISKIRCLLPPNLVWPYL